MKYIWENNDRDICLYNDEYPIYGYEEEVPTKKLTFMQKMFKVKPRKNNWC